VTDIIRIGLDTSKSLFQLHGVDAAEQPVLRRIAASVTALAKEFS
jgi:transposase